MSKPCRGCGGVKEPGQGRAYCDQCFGTPEERRNTYARQYRKDNPERMRDIRLRCVFGLSLEDFNGMLAGQDGLCAVCRRPETRKNNNGAVMPLCVDHDHETGKLRSLLCHSCNSAIGHFNDDPYLMERAARYVRDHRNYSLDQLRDADSTRAETRRRIIGS